MRCLFIFLILLLPFFSSEAFSQANVPTFLQGTWKMETSEVYEHWDLLDDGSMKGYSYRIADGEEVISEYLEIRQRSELVIYTATVLDQNDGKGIEFVLHQPDSLTFSFENPEHDFPKKIIYQKRSDSEIYVQVSDGGERGFSYKMKKVAAGEPNILTSFFEGLKGVWIASPDDSSFVSRLKYKKGDEQFLLPVKNTLSSKTGELFVEYEGVYVYNPVEENITFTTVTKNEIHTGFFEVKGDTLFHEAQISGSGNIKSYSSAIIKMANGTLHYYADYSESDSFPELGFQEPLIYRRIETIPDSVIEIED